MVYCRYCGAKNRDGVFHCKKCGKPLSLVPNIYSENMNKNKPNYNNKRVLDRDLRTNNQNKRGSLNQGSIKSRYRDKNRFNTDFDENDYGTDKFNTLSPSQTDYYGDSYGKNLKKENKNYVEWDVVVATALLIIILSTILQRFFPRLGLFVALFVGLIYILIATKSKSSLFKAIPLAIVMVFAISAYFSL